MEKQENGFGYKEYERVEKLASVSCFKEKVLPDFPYTVGEILKANKKDGGIEFVKKYKINRIFWNALLYIANGKKERAKIWAKIKKQAQAIWGNILKYRY